MSQEPALPCGGVLEYVWPPSISLEGPTELCLAVQAAGRSLRVRVVDQLPSGRSRVVVDTALPIQHCNASSEPVLSGLSGAALARLRVVAPRPQACVLYLSLPDTTEPTSTPAAPEAGVHPITR
jgi:hypothetical protein